MKQKPNSYNQLSDESLMERIVRADKVAFTTLYNRWALRVKGFFMRLCKNDEDSANDHTQDLFLKLLERSSTFDINQKFAPWLFTIAYNQFNNSFRKRNADEHYLNYFSKVDESFDAGLEKKIDLKNSSAFVQNILNQLNPEVKSIFVLRYAEDLTIPEIARITSLPEGTIKSRLFYALKKLSKERQKHQLSEWI